MELIKPEFIYTRTDRPDLKAEILNVAIVYGRSTIIADKAIMEAKFDLVKQTQYELRALITHNVFNPVLTEMFSRSTHPNELRLCAPLKQLRDLWMKG